MTKYQHIQAKIFTLDTLNNQVEVWRKNGEQIVFTNGCFDILHQGHVAYLAKAADCGTKLIVAVNTDASVREQNKGPERPVNPETARQLILAALEVVDAVVLFDDNTPQVLIKLLLPNVLVKGADYDANETDANNKKYIVGREYVLNNGGQVKTIELEVGFSTTSIIQKLSSK
jgi:rfaE bifunctional protein nucleotidyltransferase chain/domain